VPEFEAPVEDAVDVLELVVLVELEERVLAVAVVAGAG
jgi:hypothetical protein